MKTLPVLMLAVSSAFVGFAAGPDVPALVPMPRKMTLTGGATARTNVTRVVRAGLPAEGYTLVVAPQGVTVEAAGDAGFFYADETLKQLATTNAAGAPAYPCVTIEDAPAYRWRGVMVDEGRNFFGKAAILRLLDAMALCKLNVFHWHLTEDQGWRLAIDKYPNLVKYGAVRPSSPMRGRHYDAQGERYTRQDFTPYGPFFYTAADVREICARAKALHIRVVPEIEMPGHSRAVLAAYPEFNCLSEGWGTGEPWSLGSREPWTRWGVNAEPVCAGSDEVIKFFEDVLDEVCALFPDSPDIHLGGDECVKARWKSCPRCQARIKAEGLKDEQALQGWFVGHFKDYLAKKGRRFVGWGPDAGDDSCFPSNGVAMCWKKNPKILDAMRGGVEIVQAPFDTCYVSDPQFETGDAVEYKRTWADHALPLSRTYTYDPVAGIPADLRGHVLGGEACCWSEAVREPWELEWKLWPRTCAIAEALWTAPTNRDFAAFSRRLAAHRPRLLALGLDAAPLAIPSFGPDPAESAFQPFDGRLTKRAYTNFVLRLEFRPDPNGGWAGIGLRADPSGAPAVVVPLVDNAARRLSGLRPWDFCGALGGVMAPDWAPHGAVVNPRRPLRGPGEWNSIEVRAEGQHFRVRLNGATVLDADISGVPEGFGGGSRPGLHRASGRLSFDPPQAGGAFRHVRIADLD